MLGAREALAQLGVSKKPQPGSRILLEDGSALEVLDRQGEFYTLRYAGPETLEKLLLRLGHMPLPPYIARAADAADAERYQTIYARTPGAVAAPTAGLHFDQKLLDALSADGVEFGYVTLHVGVGTTVVRALEAARRDGEVRPFAGETQIFIFPGYRITSVDALITNFHLPESTLLMLVSAFAGRELILDAYRHAVAERYRFFSYGDAMLILPPAR